MASVAYNILLRLQQAGAESPFLGARLEYSEAAQLLHQHILPMQESVRVYPTMLIPQASGRVGISRPPLGNFTADPSYGPRGLRDVIRPDPGTKWVHADWSAVEGWIVSHRCRDAPDLEVKARGLDLHAVTAIRMLNYPDPPFEPSKNALKTPEGVEWRARVGFDERTRTLIKNCRYTLQYARDEKAMARYCTELEMSKPQIWEYGRKYLASKPWLTLWKRKRWAEAWRRKEARTAFGRRRRLLGDQYKVQKEGLNHEIQGTVADMMKITMVALARVIPDARMVLQRHDGWYTEVSEAWGSMEEWGIYKGIVERPWVIDGREITFPAEYEEIIA